MKKLPLILITFAVLIVGTILTLVIYNINSNKGDDDKNKSDKVAYTPYENLTISIPKNFKKSDKYDLPSYYTDTSTIVVSRTPKNEQYDNAVKYEEVATRELAKTHGDNFKLIKQEYPSIGGDILAVAEFWVSAETSKDRGYFFTGYAVKGDYTYTFTCTSNEENYKANSLLFYEVFTSAVYNVVSG
jgi:hypothetical protein